MSSSHSDLKPTGSPLSHSLLLQLDRADLAQRDELVASIAKRMVGAQRSKRHTRTDLRSLAFPISVGEQVCLAAVVKHFIMSHPREHLTETHWYENVAAARAAYPEARLLSDVPSVAPRLAPGRA